VREPWALHLLTADGTNAAAEDAETMKAPAEPGLARLTPIGVEMLVEGYVRWVVQKKNTNYFGALPGPFVAALMEFSPSGVPVARAINTAPLDDRFHESCHKRGIHLSFPTPIYVTCAQYGAR
jgi:hypothetical protein